MADSVERFDENRPRWVDGGSGGGYQPHDNRPAYAPAAVVIAVQRLLREAGIAVDPDPSMLHTASIAAGDLLRALGVRPEVAPMRSRQQ